MGEISPRIGPSAPLSVAAGGAGGVNSAASTRWLVDCGTGPIEGGADGTVEPLVGAPSAGWSASWSGTGLTVSGGWVMSGSVTVFFFFARLAGVVAFIVGAGPRAIKR